MKTSLLRLATAVGLSIGALALPTTALAAGPVDPSIFRSSGQNAQATFDLPDPNNPCLDTSGFVFGGNFTSTSPGSPSTMETYGGAFVVTSDNCAGTLVSAVSYKGVLSPGAFQIDKTLTSASLQATAMGWDQNGNQVPLTINVTWTGSGALTTGTYSSHYQRPGVNIVTRSSGESRDATANGTVAVAGSTLTFAGAGSLQSSSGFELLICHSASTGCK
jgi:hypothetical protein